ncbi:MAG: caspase family protein [Myxococcales bacterium]|nr:caspase family protein [Myxococcales bacterium]
MAFVALVLLAGGSAWADGRRFALVIGENRGLLTEEHLRFAESDAQRFRDALVEVGGVAPQDVVLLTGATAPQVREALTALSSRMAGGPYERLTVFFSSHAGDGVLHLAGTELPLQELVDFVKAAPVRVGLLVVDACQSGSVTRLKGLRPSELPPTRLEATGVEGRVFISASGADEYAQESDSLGGSYFTHFLVAGLRGAADTSKDGRVTLEEAYAWAWARTIEATFATRGGVQRPAFSVDLRGQGQLVLSEPGAAKARLTLAVEAPGRWLVVAEDSGAVLADVDKPSGPLTLALPPGGYRLKLRTKDGLLERGVTVPAAGGAVVRGEDLERASLVQVAAKGGPESLLVFSLGGGVSSGLVSGLSVQPGVELRFRRDAYLLGPLNQWALALAWRTGTSMDATPFTQHEFELRVGTGHRFAWRRGSVAVGVEVGPLLVLQSLPNDTARTSLGVTGALDLEGRLKVGGPVELFLLGTGGAAVVKKSSGVAVVPRLGATAGVAVSF